MIGIGKLLLVGDEFWSEDTWRIIGLVLSFGGTASLMFIKRGKPTYTTLAAILIGVGVAVILDGNLPWNMKHPMAEQCV